jgi:PAX-interacting protein 1
MTTPLIIYFLGMPPQSQQQHMMAQQQQQMLAMQQRNNALRNVTNVTAAAPQHATMMGGKPAGMAGMAGAAVGPRFGPRTVGPTTMVGMRPGGPVPGGIPQARLPQFIGHHIETRLPPDLCLLGCIFVVTDYQDSEEYAKFVASWKKTITQYGGEIETSLSPRVTHLLCSSQKSALAQQARVEGKRLVTCYWLNDTIRKKKVMPPWKAIHFPLPAQFEPPCTNMILCLTGFQDRDRDLVKVSQLLKLRTTSSSGI